LSECPTGWYAECGGDSDGAYNMASHSVRRFTELEAWLQENGNESGRAFALRAGLSKSKLNRLLNGDVTQFDFELIRKVETATKGAIGHDAFAAFGKRLTAPVKSKRRAA
jgi:hypothetical protein